MNKSRMNKVSIILYEAEHLKSALREITRYIIYAMIHECKFNYEGVIEDMTLDFRELRTEGILNPKDVLSIELALLSCILDFVEKDICKGEISRKNITPFVDMFISEITALSTIHIIDISNDHIALEEFNKVGLINALSNSQTESITHEEVNTLLSKMKEYQSSYDLLHNSKPISTIPN